jgi:hypothetical protein
MPSSKGRVRELVAEAKARGQSSITLLPSISDPPGLNSSLDGVLNQFGVVVAEPVTSRTLIQGESLATWFRYRVVSILDEKPPRTPDSPVTPPDDISSDLTDATLLVGREGGRLTVEGVDVVQPLNWPFDKGKQYLLFVVISTHHTGVVAGGIQGIFEIGRDGLLIRKSNGESPLSRSLLLQSANSLDGLRRAIQSRRATRH